MGAWGLPALITALGFLSILLFQFILAWYLLCILLFLFLYLVPSRCCFKWCKSGPVEYDIVRYFNNDEGEWRISLQHTYHKLLALSLIFVTLGFISIHAVFYGEYN